MAGCGGGSDDGDGSGGRDGSDNPVDHYLALLAGDDLDERWQAIQRLPNVNQADRQRAKDGLRKLAVSGSGHVRGAAAVALTNMDPSADDVMPALTEALDDRDHRVRAAAMEAIVRFGCDRPDVQAAVSAAVANDEVKVRLAAIDALVRMRPRTPEITQLLAGRLDDPFRMVRQRAIDALVAGGMEDPDTFAALIGAIDHPQRHVRLAAMAALVAADPTRDGVMAALTEHLTHEDAKLAGMAQDRLVTLGPDVPGIVTAWAEALKSPEDEFRRAVVDRLTEVPPSPEVIELLGSALWDTDHLTYGRAIRRLLDLGLDARPAAPMLLRLLAGPRTRGHIAAMELLVPMAEVDPTLTEPLCDALLTEDGQVRQRMLNEMVSFAKHLDTLSELLAGLILRPELDQAKKIAALNILTALGGWAKPAGPILRDALEQGAPPGTPQSEIQAFLAHLAETPEAIPTRLQEEEH